MFFHAVERVILVKKSRKPIRGDFAFDPAGEHAGTCLTERTLGCISGKNLNVKMLARTVGRFQQQHAQGVRLFTAGAGRHPAPDSAVVGLGNDQRSE